MRCSVIITKVMLVLALNAFALHVTAQYPTDADALRTLSRSAPHDTTRAQAFLFLAASLRDSEPNMVLSLCDSSVHIADKHLNTGFLSTPLKVKEKRAYHRVKATGLLNIGYFYHERGDLPWAQKHYERAFEQFTHANFRRGTADAMAALGVLRKEKGWTTEGDKLIQDAAQLYERAPNVAFGSIGYRSAAEQAQRRTIMQAEEEPVEVGRADNGNSETANVEPPGPNDPREVVSPHMPTVTTEISSTEIVDMLAAPPDVSDDQEKANASLVAGIDTAVISKYRERLTQPVREDGGALEARDNLERGEALELIREPERAMVSFMRSRDVFRRLRSDTGECVALLRIGKLRGDLGEYKEAFTVLDSARLKAREIGRSDLEGVALAGMGDMCRRIAECGDQAANLYRHSIEMALAAGDKRTEARSLLGITQDLVEKGALKQAEPIGQKGLDIAMELNDADLKQQGAVLLRDVYSGLGLALEAQEMGELVQDMEVYIAKGKQHLDSTITELHKQWARKSEQDSLAYQAKSSALELNWLGERAIANKNRTAAIIIAACALVAILGGLIYYRFDRRRRQGRAERRATELEIKALRSQMNPHFLFNALSSIHEHILENEADVAADYLAKFSKLTRQVLEMSRLSEVPLQRELEVLGMYTELERMRLKGRFSYAVDIAPDVDPTAVTVPPMLLQPFVENAVWHGLSRKEGLGHLRISVSQVDGTLRVTIEDDGLGRSVTSSNGSGHTSLGTSITKERLELWAAQRGVPASFAFVPVPIGTRVDLVLPWDEV